MRLIFYFLSFIRGILFIMTLISTLAWWAKFVKCDFDDVSISLLIYDAS